MTRTTRRRPPDEDEPLTGEPAVAVPEQVSVAMDEIAADMREGLLALAVGAGLQVMAAMMEADVDRRVRAAGQARPGPGRDPARHRGRVGHPGRAAGAGAPAAGARRRRVRGAAGAAYELFTGTELLGRMAMERMLAGLSTRRYPAGAGAGRASRSRQAATSTSKSAVSRRFVAMTETALADLLAADLSGLDLVALMIDGVHFAEHLCVVALGIDIDGTKHPLAVVEGSTENTTLVRGLLVGLRERGLDITRPILAVLDGSKALRRAVQEVFDHPVIARCQLHKISNVRDHLPETAADPVEKRMRQAYHADSALDAEAQLEALAASWTRPTPAPRPACAKAWPRR